MKDSLKITALGGLGEIGMNCLAIDSGQDILVVDCGLLFTDLETFGIRYIIPNFASLLERKNKLKGFVITHAHEDHIGALPYAIKAGLNAPIYCSDFARVLIEHKLEEAGLKNKVEIRRIQAGKKFEVGGFSVKPVSVNHSIIEALALFIDTPLGRIIHTGDFKFDAHPFYGRVMDFEDFQKAGDDGVLLLLSDSTNVEVCRHSTSEAIVLRKFEELFAVAEGLTVVSMFASNVARMGQVFKLAHQMGKKVATAGRTMESNIHAALGLDYLPEARSCLISIDELDRYPRKDVIVLSTGSQGEFRSALTRVASGEHRQILLQPGDRVIMSSKFIPGNEVAISRMINQLFKQGAEVFYEAMHEVHASGHASRLELERMLKAVRPRFFVPVHGEYRHLVHHAALARETGVPAEHVKVISNGETFEVTSHGLKVIDRYEDHKVLIDEKFSSELTRDVLKDRRRLAEKGVVFVMFTRNSDTGALLTGPEIVIKGVLSESDHEDFRVRARELVRKTVREFQRDEPQVISRERLEEEVRVSLSHLLQRKYLRKANISPVIVDL